MHMHSISRRRSAGDKEEPALDLSVAIAMEVQGLTETGVCMAQVDEPIFSKGICRPVNGS